MAPEKARPFELKPIGKGSFRFLIVDDEPVARELLRAVIKGAGYTSIEDVDSGDAALSALSKEVYHVILLDIQLPGTDGIEVLRRGRALRPDSEFILITAYGSMKTVVEAMDLGAISYITKPFAEAKVVATRVERALERVAIRYQNTLLLEAIRAVLDELDRAETALGRLRRRRPSSAEPKTRLASRVRKARVILTALADRMDTLRLRARGSAAKLLSRFEGEVSDLAELLSGQIEDEAPRDGR